MKYLCTNCNYIYDESLGDLQEGIEGGTLFYNLGDYFECPVCGDDRDSFHEIIEEVNYIYTDKHLDFIELEHFIDTTINEDIVLIKIGKEIHPSGDDHRITEISIYDEYGDLVENKFIKTGEGAKVEFDISYLDDFEIRARCSIHGLWGIKINR